MLDSEPDNNVNPSNVVNSSNDVNTSNGDALPAEAPKRPRRRAASRPAGPPSPAAAAQPELPAPSSQADSTPQEPSQPGPSLPETRYEPAEGASATRTTARKTAAKKTAAKKTAKTAAKKTTARKTAAKKTAQSPESTGESSAPTAEAPETSTVEATAESTEAAAGESEAGPAKKTTTRKAPAKKTTTKRTRKAPAKKAAAPAVELTEPTEPAEAQETVAAGTTTQPDAEPTPDLSIEDAIASAMNATLAEREQAVPSDGAADGAQVEQTAAAEPVTTTPEPAAEAVAQVDAEAEAEGTGEEIAADSAGTAEETAAETAAETAGGTAGEAAEGTDTDSDDTDESEDHDEGGNRRRRRRRGGRRRRRGRGADGSDATGDESSEETGPDEAGSEETDAAEDSDRPSKVAAEAGDEEPDAEHDESADEAGSDDDTDGESGDGKRRRRRRRRRRKGEDTAGAPDDPSDVVVRVREPRKASDEVTGIDGSTRMEAKRQRRREGREAGRRRAPIISEAEFLARRESVNRKMIIRQRDDLAQIAVLEDGILVEHYVDRESANSLIGNVYLGRVQNVLPSMEAAFIDIGRGRNAVLYAGEVDWDSFGAEGHDRKVENVLKSGQTVLVQVTKDPVGAKGARLTNHVSIPGRYVVYAPSGHLSGISRKLPETERKRLKEILDAAVGETASVIVRTAAEGASEDELTRDVNRLKAQWEDIERKVKAGNAPQLLYAEPDLTLRIVRDLFTEDFSELIIQGNGSANDTYDALEAYMQHVAPHLADRMKRWDADKDGDLFGSYRLDEQIAKGLERKVFLPSGGSLIIDRTEAMTVIDVNTGKFTGSGGNLEATITSNNLEAAEEIVRQLRLRDIGGIIVIDFIDMVLPSNRELLLRRLVECLGRDRTRHQVAEVTSLGLVQMTRKRIGTGLLEAFSTECPHCHGRGVELHDMPVADAKMADGGAREDHGRSGRRRGGKGRKNTPAEVPAAS
ncbi:Rne/Rng family ribonuclease [Microlunatus sp. Gsoil 973]|uniref:Rne/Rng family ribonuclease n=1 Tax=Microlunatus sp. Gsoil 973 TaxID=2672569 RepID=UPI0012B48977|nr:Rne/Rng family ribonuclease [Microlunatus sp. Gsoil 973]QGN31671.1 Rne/Rng family ribonuclease [Microlunatus sp. Gsoil 973]